MMRYWQGWYFTATYPFGINVCRQTNHIHVPPAFDISGVSSEKAIYSHTLLTAGMYAFGWNAIQNAGNIFSSRQQTAKGTSGSSSVWEQLFLSQCGPPITVILCLTPSRPSGLINIFTGIIFFIKYFIYPHIIFLWRRSNKVWDFANLVEPPLMHS